MDPFDKVLYFNLLCSSVGNLVVLCLLDVLFVVMCLVLLSFSSKVDR